MDPESKKLLEENLRLAEENNKMLRSLHRSMRLRRFVSIIYWVLIIGSTVGAYYFIQPYIEQVVGVYSGGKDKLDNINKFFESFQKNTPR